MTSNTKSRIPVIRIAFVVLAVVVGGTMLGVDYEALARKVFEERHRGKEVCFNITNTPRQIVAVAWHVGAAADHFTREFRRWDHCERAEVGENVGLSVDQSRGGVTKCSAVVMPENIQLGGGPKTAAETGICFVSGVVA